MRNSSSLLRAEDPADLANRLLQRAYTRDGLPEISVGLFFLLVSGLMYSAAVLPHGTLGFRIAIVAFALGVPAFTLGARPLLNWVRRRYLIKREGYVQHEPAGRKQIGAGILIAVATALVLLGVVTRLSQPERWLLAGTGLAGGALAAWCGRLPRFVVGGLAVAVTGVLVALAGVSLEIGFTILFGVQGLAALISGALAFLRFIRKPIE